MSIVQHIRVIVLIAVCAFACAIPVYAQEDGNDGSSCEKAIFVDKDFSLTSCTSGEKWFTAYTYDLPVQVDFIPTKQDGTAIPPKLEFDLACNGEYDPDIQALLDLFPILKLPIQLSFNSATIGDKDGFTLTISDFYRKAFDQYGITRNVQVYVHITVTDGGDVDVIIDPTSRDCLEESHKIELPDTLDVAYADAGTAYAVFMSDWVGDSVRFTWTGTEEADLWLAKTSCTFVPTYQDEYVLERYVIPAGGYYTFSKDAIDQFISDHGEGGRYYAKVITYCHDGQMIVDYAPVIKPEGVELHYDEATPVAANDTTVFYFDKTWTATHFEVASDLPCRMYLDTGSQIDPNIRSSYIRYYDLDYDTITKHRYLNLSDYEVSVLTNQQDEGKNYLYCKIITSSSTTVTPSEWEIDDCLKNTIQMRSGDTIILPSSGTVPKMRMYYNEWKDYDIVLTRIKNNKALAVGMTDDCSKTTPSSTTCSPYKSMNSTTLTWTAKNADITAQGAPAAGYYLWIFNNNRTKATICFTAKAPEGKECTITVVADPAIGGSVTGGGKYMSGTSATLTATPEAGCYAFDQWDDGNRDNPRTVTVAADKTYTAKFKPIEYTVRTSAMGGGTVSIINRKNIY